jgi:hypothetical protein
MKRLLLSVALAVTAVSFFTPKTTAEDPLRKILKQEGYTVSLDLKFTRKSQSSLQHVISFLDWGPNGYATGFLVGNGLVMTAYHVVSGDLSITKKVQLGFGPKDQLRVSAWVNGCEANVIKVDEDADLALLSICQSQKNHNAPAFQATVGKDEPLVLFARPHGDKRVRRGTASGPYLFRGLEYCSADMDVRDGYSGSPVYNQRAEIVGVFSGYDWSKRVALISPGGRAQKLLEDYVSAPKP